MNDQPNKMATLEWLLPLFYQELSLLSNSWLTAHVDDQAQARYHQVSGALCIANLPKLAELAELLSIIAASHRDQSLTATTKRLAQFGHQLLTYELTQFAQHGSYRQVLVAVTSARLKVCADKLSHGETGSLKPFNDKIANQDVVITVPDIKTVTFTKAQYSQLLQVWRQKLQSLLTENTNSAQAMAALVKVSHYLWHANIDQPQRALWYLTELWLKSLVKNDSPVPAEYGQVLAGLEQLIANYAAPEGQSTAIADSHISSLTSEVYLQLALLDDLEADAKSLLFHLPEAFEISQEFLPHILSQLENIIFNLTDARSIIQPLQQVVTQLELRGWSLYETQAAQILAEVEESFSHDLPFDEIKWQIERQLQELYSAIYHTEQSIKTKIGAATTFILADNEASQLARPISDDALRQIRIAVEDIKQHFNDYVQRQQSHLLPPIEAFFDIGDAFEDMGLSAIRTVTDRLGTVITQLADQKNMPPWFLIQALADGLSAIEVLLDHLAQQVFDQRLLQKAESQGEKAAALFETWLKQPDADLHELSYPLQSLAQDVIRYDDDGEVLPPPLSIDTQAVTLDTDSHPGAEKNTEALQLIQDDLKSDDFDIDEDIREIFIEEAEEVLDALTASVPVWAADAQNLALLTDIRRSFHTLKGSGRMVGAFSIGEAAWAIENLLNRVLDKTLPVSQDVVKLITKSLEPLSILTTDFANKRSPSTDPALIILQSQNLLFGRELMSGLESAEITELLTTDQALAQETADHLIAPAKEDRTIKALAAEATGETAPEVIKRLLADVAIPADSDDADPEIKDIFIEEAEEVLAEIRPLYQSWQQDIADLAPLKDIRRGFHTLKGSGRMVGACYSAELAWAIENMLNRVLDGTLSVSKDIAQLVGDVISAYPRYIEVFASGLAEMNYPSQTKLWIACATAFSNQLGDQFSYQELAGSNTAQADQTELADINATAQLPTSHAEDDFILQAYQSAQEIISEAISEIPSQSEEEEAFAAIFIEEAYELLEQINDFMVTNQDRSRIEVSDDIVRAFHTLRAASGSSALLAISEVSKMIEQSLEQLQQQDELMDDKHLQAITQSTHLIERYLQAYEQSYAKKASDTEQSQDPEDLAVLQDLLARPEAKQLAYKNQRFSVAELLKVGIDTLLDADCYLRHALSDHSDEQLQYYINQQRKQITQLREATKNSPKFEQILTALAHAYDYLYHHVKLARQYDVQSLLLSGHDELVGLFDALAGSMSLKINPQVLAELKALGDGLYQPPVTLEIKPDIDDDSTDKMATDYDTPTADSEACVSTEQAEALTLEVIETDVELLEIFLEEAQEIDSAIAQTFSKWRADKDNIAVLKTLQRHLHTIKGGARMAGIHSIGDLTHEAESVYEAIVEGRFVATEQWLDIMQAVQDTLSLQIDYVIRYRESFFAKALIQQLQEFVSSAVLPQAVTLTLPALQSYLQDDDFEDSTAELQDDHHVISLEALIAESWQDELPDADILEVFLEEADELAVSSNKYLQLFLNNISDVVALQALQRDLHTIKGGARMVGANGIADLAHQMETVYEELAIRRRPATKMIAQLLEACHDWLADAVFILKHQVNPPTPKALIAALIEFSKNPDSLKQVPHQSLQSELSIVLAAKSKQEEIRGAEDISQIPPMTGSFVTQEQSQNHEMIRISSNLIERMINLSGESAINRARIDMGMSSLTNSIEEMGVTIQRLADQLRRMEIELEAQILAQIDDTELIDSEGFDPLEMDQYSSLNQLSKSLSESASDLVDINSTLLEKTRDSENLLLQLSRTQTDLQDGLMNSRMVPFSRLTPRLERIVRQTANELGKSVELTIVNADDEMDRSILERITSPLEHMLRNAVDHGIESPQARLNAGKERSGQITIEVIREGSEMVIHLTDDGRGINVDAVRKKAIAQGLIDANDKSLSDIDVMQYIFHAGLTTTKQVTQISGRGVGMDVVISEIKQLGGLVSVTSKPNQGSRFTMRVPLTVAIADALVVRAADRYYAIPLVQIERVVRVQPDKLFNYYQSNQSVLRIDDDDYRVHYLNEILTGSRLNEMVVNSNSSLPVIIVKNRAGQNLALQVDQIAGSRIEVVVKPLGRQLSHLPGISAATIMGDGSVMLILDMLALLRNAVVLKDVKPTASTSSTALEAEPPTILVVDDSVTVRKVTSRFLEREGFKAVVAKDGVDAIEILQELMPDLILLDIEMPRMDGFEVATQIRHDRRLKHLPIIMITSRTGEKHRERAFEIGVNDYMGKPFQENELLVKIQNNLSVTIGATHDA
ncbi:Hpt domain-containing protein [Psychrobacter ciconiae]|uniref:Hpt domain-containing protein n=1 Tax=Psychrobacter ciconiae TaxID=1553449 RepID=UPI00191958C5|nr:Hpt domain-containing protein [Psychrobacter ciconiae]